MKQFNEKGGGGIFVYLLENLTVKYWMSYQHLRENTGDENIGGDFISATLNTKDVSEKYHGHT